jgi:hypothetical protein
MERGCYLAKNISPKNHDALCAKADFNHGWNSAFQQIAEIYAEKVDFRYIDSYHVATYFIAFNDKDKAIEWLYRGYEDRSSNMNFFAVDPVWDNLRSDPRFREPLRRMNLENVKPTLSPLPDFKLMKYSAIYRLWRG